MSSFESEMLGCWWPELQLSVWSVWSPEAGPSDWTLSGLWEALVDLADPASWVLWSAPGAVVVAAFGTVSLLPGCDIGVVVTDGDPARGITEVLVLPEVLEGVGPWTEELEEEGLCLVGHWGRGTTHSLELWGGSVLSPVVLTVVLGT